MRLRGRTLAPILPGMLRTEQRLNSRCGREPPPEHGRRKDAFSLLATRLGAGRPLPRAGAGCGRLDALGQLIAQSCGPVPVVCSASLSRPVPSVHALVPLAADMARPSPTLDFPLSPGELVKWCRFATTKGGIGRAVALVDRLADSDVDLMFLRTDEIVILYALEDNEHFLGYCEGVCGRLRRDDVQIIGRLKVRTSRARAH